LVVELSFNALERTLKAEVENQKNKKSVSMVHGHPEALSPQPFLSSVCQLSLILFNDFFSLTAEAFSSTRISFIRKILVEKS